jgi:hypothetical protein
MEDTSMKLEVGKRYRNGVGEVIEIVEYDAKDPLPYRGDDGLRYLSDGRFTDYGGHRYNLVSEVPDDPDPKWEALVEVLRELAEGNEMAQHALRRLEETLETEP